RRSFVFLFRATAISAIYSLSLHDALPILDGVETSARAAGLRCWLEGGGSRYLGNMEMLCPKCHNLMRRYERNGVIVDQCSECGRSEEHTSELQSRENLVCRLLLEKKKKQK